MASGRVRAIGRVRAVVYATGMCAALLGFRPSSEAIARERTDTKRASPEYLADDAGKPTALVYAPRRSTDSPQPVTVMLHGMCDEPEWECPHFASSTTPGGWLVCPRANLRCDGGGSIWSGDSRFLSSIEASVARAKQEHPEEIDDTAGRTLIGFSLGAIRAVDVAHEGRNRYRYVILMGAKVYPDAAKLRAAGVERIVLAAGDYDMMKGHMVGQTKKLERKGFPARFISLGKVGHTFPKDLGARLTDAIEWLHEDPNNS